MDLKFYTCTPMKYISNLANPQVMIAHNILIIKGVFFLRRKKDPLWYSIYATVNETYLPDMFSTNLKFGQRGSNSDLTGESSAQ